MQKSYQYVHICIHVNLLPRFFDIMSCLITVTSVEEDSSLPSPFRAQYRAGLFGGGLGVEITCYRVCVRRRSPDRSQPWLPYSVCYPRSPTTLHPLHYLVENRIWTAGVKGVGSLPTGLCTLQPKLTGKSREKKEDHVLADPLFSYWIINVYN